MSNTVTEIPRFEQPLAQLRDARRELIREQGRIARNLRALDAAIRELERIGRSDQKSPDAKDGAAGPLNEFQRMTAREAARAVLAKSPHPLTVREMLSMMQEAGRPVTRNSYHAVYRQLRTHNEFKNAMGRWYLTDGAHAS